MENQANSYTPENVEKYFQRVWDYEEKYFQRVWDYEDKRFFYTKIGCKSN